MVKTDSPESRSTPVLGSSRKVSLVPGQFYVQACEKSLDVLRTDSLQGKSLRELLNAYARVLLLLKRPRQSLALPRNTRRWHLLHQVHQLRSLRRRGRFRKRHGIISSHHPEVSLSIRKWRLISRFQEPGLVSGTRSRLVTKSSMITFRPGRRRRRLRSLEPNSLV